MKLEIVKRDSMGTILQIILLALAGFASLQAETLTVGPNGKFQAPCQALTVAKDGDTIEIDAAGTYKGDVCAFRANNLLVRGVNGRPRIEAAGRYADYKGIWAVYGNNLTVENLEMSGAAVPDRNGCAIRFSGVNLTLRRVYFHDNEEGVLTGGLGGDILVEYSEFDRNGDGAGYAHNIYVNAERSLTVRFSYFHRSNVGNVLKSRAAQNYLLYNRFAAEEAPSSWKVDLPNGGYSVVLGNVIQQGPNVENISFLSYMTEGGIAGYDNTLLLAHNTFVNEGPGEDSGTPAYFVAIGKDSGYSVRGQIANNIFAGPGSVINPEGLAQQLDIHDNLVGEDPLFVSADQGDYRLTSQSPAIGAAGLVPDQLATLQTPVWQMQSPTCGQLRPQSYPLSLGAFEFGAAEPNLTSPCVVNMEGLNASMAFSANQLKATADQVARVYLDGVAPPGGAEVLLNYSHPQLVQGPAKVVIPAGEASIPVSLHCVLPVSSTVTTVTAVYENRPVDSRLSFVVPVVYAPTLNRLVLSATEITGGLTSEDNVVQLGTSAPSPVTINLTSSRPDLVSLPASVVIGGGANRAAFSLTTRRVTERVLVQVTATQGGTQKTVPLMIQPVILGHLSFPGSVLGASATYSASLTLTGPAPEGGIAVQLSSTASDVISLPPVLNVPGGAAGGSFELTTASVAAPVKVQIRASYGDVTRSTSLKVDRLSIASVQLGSTALTSGLTSGDNLVMLNAPAPNGRPINIRLSTSDAALAQVQDQVIVQPGTAAAFFQITTGQVKAKTSVIIKAASDPPLEGKPEASAVLTLKP